MFKLMVLIKRRPGMSMADFMAYYDDHHAVLAARHLPHTRAYHRHYLTPLGDHVGGQAAELPYDVITEMHFDDEAAFGEAMAILGRPEVSEAITTDESNLFDRATITFMRAETHSTDMAQFA